MTETSDSLKCGMVWPSDIYRGEEAQPSHIQRLIIFLSPRGAVIKRAHWDRGGFFSSHPNSAAQLHKVRGLIYSPCNNTSVTTQTL